jgi:GNAT superfamily N-acetyltransferase
MMPPQCIVGRLDGASGVIAGWQGRRLYTRYLIVPTDMRGRGLGTRIMGEVEREARARSARPQLSDNGQASRWRVARRQLRIGIPVPATEASP